MNHDHPEKPPSFWRSRTGLAFLGLFAIAAFFLLTEHRAHALGVLPFLLLALCPLLHLFGHGGHDHGAEKGDKP
jgi:hypothetical protein